MSCRGLTMVDQKSRSTPPGQKCNPDIHVMSGVCGAPYCRRFAMARSWVSEDEASSIPRNRTVSLQLAYLYDSTPVTARLHSSSLSSFKDSHDSSNLSRLAPLHIAFMRPSSASSSLKSASLLGKQARACE